MSVSSASTHHQHTATTSAMSSSRSLAPNPARDFFAGGCAGLTAAVLTCPLEVVKTKLQSRRNSQVFTSTSASASTTRSSSGIVSALERSKTFQVSRNIWATEGYRGFFRGISPLLAGVVPARAVYFTAYTNAKQYLGGIWGSESVAVHMASAIAAGFCTSTATNPIWVVKTRLQVEGAGMAATTASSGKQSAQFAGGIQTALKMLKQEGIGSFYKGMTASYLGIGETMIQLAMYEQFKRIIQNRSMLRERAESSGKAVGLANQATEVALAAGLAKFIACIMTYPHEVARTRLREQAVGGNLYNGVFHCFQRIAREEGPRGLYAGMGAHLLRVVPNSAIMFLTYETAVSLWNRFSAVDQPKNGLEQHASSNK